MLKVLRTVACFLLAVILTGTQTDVTHAAPAKKYHCWKIEQTTMLWGDSTIYACPQALRVYFKNGKWMNLSKAPDWQLLILNPSEKIYCTTTLAKWKGNLLQPNSLTDLSKLSEERTNDGTIICGMPTQRIEFGRKQGQKDWVARKLGKINYWVARDIKLPDEVYHVLCGNAGIPNLHAVPLRTQSNSHFVSPLETTAITQVDVPANFFDIPAGYKFTAKDIEVMNAGMTEIIKDMGGM